MRVIALIWAMPAFLFLVCTLFAQPVSAQGSPALRKTKNVVLIISDGLRWQEIFTGAEQRTSELTDHGGSWAKPEQR